MFSIEDDGNEELTPIQPKNSLFGEQEDILMW
jgi:hypothetical protein